MRYFLENDRLKVEIDSLGAEVKSIINKKNMQEYMWYGNPKYWNRTSPVLFPFVGSLKGKKYTWKGKEYTVPQHGFARDMEFERISVSADEIRFRVSSDEATLAIYPFPFVLEIGYRLRQGCGTEDVVVMWRVKNPADDTMYFSIGAHPGFLCPVHGFDSSKAGCKDGYKLWFEGISVIHHHGNDMETGLSIDEDIELPLDHGYATITTKFFDRCTYMVEGRQTNCVGIADEEGKHIVDVCFDAPMFAIWSPEKKNAPFICIEPWYGRCDAVDFEGDLSQRAYTNVLEAGECFEAEYAMKFY